MMNIHFSAQNVTDYIGAARARLSEKAIRVQYGETMISLARANSDFVVLTADLMYATGMNGFGEEFPSRIINVGIAEQNMAGIAAGLALCGKLPFVCGYAAFTTLRAVEQAKLDAAYGGVKVIFTGQSAGLSYGVGGPTHQTYEDVAIMRAIPNMTVLVPSDAQQVDACLRAALAAPGGGPIYIRLGRGPEFSTGLERRFEIGRAEVLRRGSDVSIVANGSMVIEAILAADYLQTAGISATVLDVHTVKPIDVDAIRDLADVPMLVVEEHSRIGGLGAAVLECLDDTPRSRVRRLGIADAFPPVGPPRELRTHLGLCAENIVLNIVELLGGSVPR